MSRWGGKEAAGNRRKPGKKSGIVSRAMDETCPMASGGRDRETGLWVTGGDG